MFMNSGEEHDQEGHSDPVMPILVMHDEKSGMTFSTVVPNKGLHPYAIVRTCNDLSLLGYEQITLKSDGEPAIKALKEAVQADSSMKIELSGRQGKPLGQIIKEESPAYDSRSNGRIESVIKSIQGQVRTMKDALESRMSMKIKDDHPCLPWMIRHAGYLRSRFHVGDTGRTP